MLYSSALFSGHRNLETYCTQVRSYFDNESSLEKSEQHMLMKARIKTKNNLLCPKKYPLLIFI